MDTELNVKLNNTLNGTSLKAIQDKNGNDIVETYLTKNSNINSTSSIDIGMIIPFAGNNDIPVGFLLCNGASVRRDTYPDLFNVIGTTYGSVDEEHFNLPDLTSRFLEGSNVGGEYKEAGLPNIEGTFAPVFHGTSVWLEGSASGSIQKIVGKNSRQLSFASGTSTNGCTYSFDASLSNPIYGNSDTVQPSSLTIRYIIKAFAGISSSTTDIEVTQLVNEVADKANRTLTNTADNVDFVVESYSDEKGNWYRKYKSGWVEQGGYVTASSEKFNHRVTFLKPYPNTLYTLTTNACINHAYTESSSTVLLDTSVAQSGLTNRATATGFYFSRIPDNSYIVRWRACGQGVE